MSTTAFQRARSEAQRLERREAILAAAVELLRERSVAELSLNELARRVGLAKSNVLRYFESREDVLLQVYDREYRAWLEVFDARLVEGGIRGIEAFSELLAATVAERPMLSELSASAAGVLERNVSGEVAAAYKRAAIANAVRLAELEARHVAPLTEAAAISFVGATNLAIGGIWAATQPSPGMAAAYDAHPELHSLRHDYRVALREFVATLLTGLAHREPALPFVAGPYRLTPEPPSTPIPSA
ncbi:TetR family transcriptional regulator [Protaetiibacter larvae]|uniref:TetR/AcrR family transcriptional regulator n=1 Tax=Protaetiibacter larvae TaxID=2592654 RepID=A0A5C1YA44_9MICO|nr:TetR family transcriptional regulator [Protaetiibacter larvae]QEO09737.1 TetR/AcrR family transcriptional regulator [Protaetiibacter larvae]